MAQRHEIEAWVNPSAWDDAEAARRAVERIMDAGTDDEDVWSAIVRMEDGATMQALAGERALAQQALDQAVSHLRGAALLALADGESEVEVAHRAGVSRTTLRKWLGK